MGSLRTGSKQTRRPLVTACWLDEQVSLAHWIPQPGGGLACSGAVSVPPDACSAARYRDAVKALAGPGAACAPAARWVVFPELLAPGGWTGAAGGAAGPRLPDWLQACWAGLGAGWLPAEVYPGMALLEGWLREWERFNQPGTGVYLPLGGRGLFLAYSRDGLFTRISRRPAGTDTAHRLDEDWLQQTRMLYRCRTGLELARVCLPGAALDDAAARLVERVHEEPPGWPTPALAGLPPALAFLHACAARAGRAAPRLFPEALTRRRRQLRLGRHLRLASCLLLGGWLLLLLGACRQRSMEVDPAPRRAWEEQRLRWEKQERRWRRSDSARARREAPCRLIGAIAGSAPPDVALQRIQLRRGAGADGIALLVEGACDGPQPADVFHGWIQQLQAASPLERVDNLQFRREAGTTRFSLQGVAALEGERR